MIRLAAIPVLGLVGRLRRALIASYERKSMGAFVPEPGLSLPSASVTTWRTARPTGRRRRAPIRFACHGPPE
jgi:hypothetical protein